MKGDNAMLSNAERPLRLSRILLAFLPAVLAQTMQLQEVSQPAAAGLCSAISRPGGWMGSGSVLHKIQTNERLRLSERRLLCHHNSMPKQSHTAKLNQITFIYTLQLERHLNPNQASFLQTKKLKPPAATSDCTGSSWFRQVQAGPAADKAQQGSLDPSG